MGCGGDSGASDSGALHSDIASRTFEQSIARILEHAGRAVPQDAQAHTPVDVLPNHSADASEREIDRLRARFQDPGVVLEFFQRQNDYHFPAPSAARLNLQN